MPVSYTHLDVYKRQHFSISAIADIMISSTKKLAQDHIDKGAELLSKGLDWMGKITGMKGATNVVKKEVNKAAKKTKKIVDEVTRNVKKAAAAVDKKLSLIHIY